MHMHEPTMRAVAVTNGCWHCFLMELQRKTFFLAGLQTSAQTIFFCFSKERKKRGPLPCCPAHKSHQQPTSRTQNHGSKHASQQAAHLGPQHPFSVAQWKRARPITWRTKDRNLAEKDSSDVHMGLGRPASLCGAAEACQTYNLEDRGSKPCGDTVWHTNTFYRMAAQ